MPCFWTYGRKLAEGSSPERIEQLLLKLLYSFADKAIHFAPSDDDRRSVPISDRSRYSLQERVVFGLSPLLRTGLCKLEHGFFVCGRMTARRKRLAAWFALAAD